MADEGRATVALVSEQVKGLKLLTEAGFKDLQRQLDAVATLPVVVTKLEGELTALDERVHTMEAAWMTGSEWRKIHLPMMVLSTCLLVVNIVFLIGHIR